MAVLVKSINGLAYASIKSRNGLAVASISRIDGLDVTAAGGFVLLAHTMSTTGDHVNTPAIDTTGADLLVVVTLAGQTYNDVTDSQSNTWTKRTMYSPGGFAVRVHYCASPSTSSSHAFSYDIGGPGSAIAVLAFSGANASPYDGENGATTSATTIQPGSVTPSVNNSLLVTGVTTFFDTISSIDSPFTIVENGASDLWYIRLAVAYEIQTTATARNPTWTGSAALDKVANIAVFKPA